MFVKGMLGVLGWRMNPQLSIKLEVPVSVLVSIKLWVNYVISFVLSVFVLTKDNPGKSMFSI